MGHGLTTAFNRSSSQFVLIGDSDHRHTGRLYREIGSDGFLDAAQARGVENICVEWNRDLQSLADDLANGRISREQFISGMEARAMGTYSQPFGELADLITAADERGIRVVFIDNNTDPFVGALNTPNAEGVYQFRADGEVFIQEYIAEHGLPPDVSQMTVDQINGMQRAFVEWALENQDKYPEILTSRLQDQNVTDYMQGVVGDQRTVVIYGRNHFASPHGMDDILRDSGQSVMWIDRFHSNSMRRQYQQYEDGTPEVEDRPDAVVVGDSLTSWQPQTEIAANFGANGGITNVSPATAEPVRTQSPTVGLTL